MQKLYLIAAAAALLNPLSYGQVASEKLIANSATPSLGAGANVALDGRYAAVQEPGRGPRGGVTLWRSDANGYWIEEDSILAPQDSSGEFGSVLAMDGDTLLIGPLLAPSFTGTRTIQVHRRAANGTWPLEANLFSPSATNFSRYGAAADIQGDRAAVGANFATVGVPNSGAVYVFQRTGSTWGISAILAPQPQFPGEDLSNERIGNRVVLLGDRIIVGSESQSPSVSRVYVFALDSAGIWQQEAVLDPFPGVQESALSNSGLAYDGATIVMTRSSPISQTNPGLRIASFVRTGTSWSALDVFTPNQSPPAFYGSEREMNRIAVRGDTVYLGVSPGSLTGAVEVYERQGNGWVFDSLLTVPGLNGADGFGASLAQDGGRLIVGAPGDDSAAPFNTGTNSGAAYIIDLEDPPLSAFCTGELGQCVACPCNNPSDVGSGAGCRNSTGQGAVLLGSGDATLADDGLRFELSGASPSSFAFLAVGTTQLPMAGGTCPPGSGIVGALLDGKRCVGGAVLRLGQRAVDVNGEVGSSNAGWGGNDAPAGGVLAASQGSFGASLYFQVFYRDSVSLGCGTGVNTSNGVKAILLP